MSTHLWVQFGLVAAGVFFAALAGQISGVAWALCAGYLIWKLDKAWHRANTAEEIMHATRIGLAQLSISVTVEDLEEKR